MKLKCLSFVLPVLCVLTGIALGAVTGKITGVITDAQTKEPIVGVSVQIVGTTMGAQTNEDGRYTILNVPVGTYALKISAVGYAPVEIEKVEVSADLASYQSHAMTSQVTNLNEVIKVTAERPLVIKDKTTSLNIVRQDEILAMPTRGIDQVVGLQNSVVTMHRNVGQVIRGSRESAGATATELNLRGGRPSEVAFYVDGFSQQDPLSGISTAQINNNAIKEISMQAGAFSAEYGNVSSGIVNVTTASGTDKYKGNIDLVTDNLVGRKHSFDQNYYSADFGGPIPGLKGAHFFLSGERDWLGDRDPRYGVKDVLPSGSRRLPNNYSGSWSYQGKIDYSFTPNVKLALSGTGSDIKWSEYNHNYLFDIQHTPWYHDQNIGLNAKLTHTLSAKTYYNLSASYFKTYRLRGDGRWRDNIWGYARIGGNPTFDNTSLFFAADNPATPTVYETLMVAGQERVFIVSIPDSSDESANYDDYYKRKSSYIGFNGDITHQFAESHTIKTGVEFQRHTLRYYRHLFPYRVYQDTAGGGFTDVDRYGYDVYGNQADPSGYKNSTKHPINFAWYVQDRLDWTGLIVNAGVRFDYFDYKSLRLRNPENPLDPDSSIQYPSRAKPGSNPQVLDQSDLEASKKFTRLSPRVGFAFPVSDKTQMHFNYGKFFQRPDLIRLYTGFDFFEYKVRNAGYFYPIGNPNLEPEKTTQYEIGMTHQLGDFTSLDVTAYYKDVTGLVQVVNQSANPNSFSTYQNTDYGTIKGIETGISMRRNHNVEFNLKYTLSWANGTGSYANTEQNVAWTAGHIPKQTSALDFDQRHDLIANIDYALGKKQGPKLGDVYLLENFRLNIVARASSGTPYSPAVIYDEVTLAAVSPVPAAPRNSEYGPWTHEIDFKAERSINIGKYQITPYIWVKNLLNTKNAYVVYESTGRPDNTGWLDTPPGQDFAAANSAPGLGGYTGTQLYHIKQDNPLNFGIPRMILFGVRASF
ncbi:hypothetical protein C3F09_12195 [candidate division GN15 bacterium]|uniref:TonB-dependent receptor n=1 Tax=candidate division GN15 bacterium TaxID=2072418 RepID=A0A855X221_9BACT|nr:MAG: hypothetical protein C3F09_12195 [candidate division GN15 bacterium]